MRNLILFFVWALGIFLVMVSFSASAQSLFPGIGGEPDSFVWLIRFIAGVVVTFIILIFQKLWKWAEGLNDNVKDLQLSYERWSGREKLYNQQLLTITTTIGKIEKRQDGHWDWIIKHDKTHAKCPDCPENKDK